ncbi:MAG: UDP-N-acetylmuramoyl-tripeptide--D-alanyl-D-alanine ligase [Sulfobacillus acidophilus]|uniref:UDP-N-acetylmuramoyl-tripeptide--D-alanyl-D-alanine ligase n=1 Tax=Sulfobacillus acidophilus TaxID=53633 RepID=A0A2T2WEL3_9FIRM|nr:MAG: UDP-N-acetylmuramoyl-tripeptide--D-alanyl-D-alanine ligase [Sulfobacillus acidophilus]
MMALTLRQVQDWTRGESEACDLDARVERLAIDSREAGRGVLFAALPGTRTDGHAFVEEVWRRGGVALVQRDFQRRGGPQIRVDSPLHAMGTLLRRYIDANHITVVGITGSVGKTSVKELVTAVLRTRYTTTSSLGNYNTAIGLPLSFFAGPFETTHFVAEMGMRAPGEILQLTRIAPPDVAVISSVGPSHLEFMGSIEAIQRAKGEILQGLKPMGLAVLNADNEWVQELGQATDKRVQWFGRAAADARIEDAQVHDTHTVITVNLSGQRVRVRLPWLGVHHAYNVAAALLVGRELGISWAEAKDGLERVTADRSRIRVLHFGSITVLEDVYNASPLSTKAALDVLQTRQGRKVAVLGDMLELGSQEVSGHQEVGAYAAERVDLLLAVGQRARQTFEAARATGFPAAWVFSREQAVQWLQETLQPGDVVLLKASRGMQFEWITEHLRQWEARP